METQKPKKWMCKRCGAIWYSTLGRKPKTCVRCKKYNWQEEKKDERKQ